MPVSFLLLRELFTKAGKEDRMVRQRSLKDLGRVASTLAEVCRMLLDRFDAFGDDFFLECPRDAQQRDSRGFNHRVLKPVGCSIAPRTP